MKRYKHKLNMLEPGTKMVKCIGITTLAGTFFYMIKLKELSYGLFLISCFVAVVLFVLLLIEHHQDEVLYEEAKKEDMMLETIGKNKKL